MKRNPCGKPFSITVRKRMGGENCRSEPAAQGFRVAHKLIGGIVADKFQQQIPVAMVGAQNVEILPPDRLMRGKREFVAPLPREYMHIGDKR